MLVRPGLEPATSRTREPGALPTEPSGRRFFFLILLHTYISSLLFSCLDPIIIFTGRSYPAMKRTKVNVFTEIHFKSMEKLNKKQRNVQVWLPTAPATN